MSRLLRMQLAAAASGYEWQQSDDDEEAQYISSNANSRDLAWSDDFCEDRDLAYNNGKESEDEESDDEEAQYYNGDNLTNHSWRSVDTDVARLLATNNTDVARLLATNNTSSEDEEMYRPPGSIEVQLPRLSIRDEDVQLVDSIIGNIKDPTIRAMLENVIQDQQSNAYGSYVNQPDPSQHSWDPIDVLYDGLLYAGFSLDRLQKNNMDRKVKWFKAFYGVEHTTVSPYLLDLQKDNPGIDYKDCFMTLNWLTLYEILPVLSARWKRSEEYIGPKVIEYATKMAELAGKKITFALEHDVEIGRSIDCATFMIQEMRQDPNSKWFDWKTHSAGLVCYLLLL